MIHSVDFTRLIIKIENWEHLKNMSLAKEGIFTVLQRKAWSRKQVTNDPSDKIVYAYMVTIFATKEVGFLQHVLVFGVDTLFLYNLVEF